MARRRAACALLALSIGLGCSREAIPADLIGVWTSDDPRYADKSLGITAEQIAFGVDPGIRVNYRVQGIEREGEGEDTTFLVFYDAPGEPERELRVRVAGPDLLEIDNHAEPWKRTGTGG
jgi:hypothetical protein